VYRSTETVGRHAWVRTPRRPRPPEPTADATVEVAAAALAEHPGATIEWLEGDGRRTPVPPTARRLAAGPCTGTGGRCRVS
jgi:hypothetical protein